MTKLRIGIFFGGSSREREVSFAGGRTVYDNLDKSLFEAIPIFVDSFNEFILLDWQYIYKGSIRDFYPPVSFLQETKFPFQVYAENLPDGYQNRHLMAKAIGKPLTINQIKQHIDFAFLALHGTFGEDGTIQGLLELNGIPYSGSGILPSSIGMNKSLQKQLMKTAGMPVPKFISFKKADLPQLKQIFKNAIEHVGLPFVVKPANQGSSVGVSVVGSNQFKSFEAAVNKAFLLKPSTRKYGKNAATTTVCLAAKNYRL